MTSQWAGETWDGYNCPLRYHKGLTLSLNLLAHTQRRQLNLYQSKPRYFWSCLSSFHPLLPHFDCSFVNMELPCDHADARLHLHLGSGPLAAGSSRNSLSAKRRRWGQRGAGRASQTWDWTRAVDRGRLWTWKLHK